MLKKLPSHPPLRTRHAATRLAVAAMCALGVLTNATLAQDAVEVTEVEQVSEVEETGVERVELIEDTRTEIETVDGRESLAVPEETLRPEAAQDPASNQPRPTANTATENEQPRQGGLIDLFGNNRNNNNNNNNQPATQPATAPPGIPQAPPLPADQLNNAQARLAAYSRLVKANYDKAIDIALKTAKSEDPFLRSNAIEALQPVPAEVLLLVREGVDDPAAVVRFASLMTIGELKFKSLAPVAMTKLNDPSASVQASAVYAAYANGQPAPMNLLPRLLTSESSGVRRNVCLVLEKIGDPSAVPMIIDMATRRNRKATPLDSTLVSVIAAKTVVALGDDSEIEVIRASAYSSYAEVRVIALMALGDLEDRVMQPALEQMLRRQMPHQAPEINLAAAYAIARMGSEVGLGTMLSFANMQVLEFDGRQYSAATLRTQAAAGLKWIEDPRAAAQLVKLLDDPNPRVRIAAADAIIAAGARMDKDVNLP